MPLSPFGAFLLKARYLVVPDVEGDVVDPVVGAVPVVPPGAPGVVAPGEVAVPLAVPLAPASLDPVVLDPVEPEVPPVVVPAVVVLPAAVLSLGAPGALEPDAVGEAEDDGVPVVELDVSACSDLRSQPANMTLSNPAARTTFEAFHNEFMICPFANVDNLSTLRLPSIR